MQAPSIIITFFLFITSITFSQTYETGKKLPNTIQPSPDGKMLSLSSLKGKMVLIDFWASWCSPCRKENAKLVEVFKKYQNTQFQNGNGFAIYSISLDSKQESWEKAIKDDQMIGFNHVSDLKGWHNEAAKNYKIRSIPSNFLIDGEGIIVGINLKGTELDSQLRRHSKKHLFWFLGFE